VVWDVNGCGYSAESLPEWVRGKTIELLKKLLSKELIIIGTRHEDSCFEFIPYLESNESILEKIEVEWDELGPPNIGGKFWVEPSQKGKELAKKLML
jgi:hypothetical protein